MARRGRGQGGGDRGAPVRQDAEVGHCGAGPAAKGGQQDAVAVEALRRAGRVARIDQLVSGREQRDPKLLADLEGGQAERRRQRHVLRTQPRPTGQRQRPARHVLPGRSRVRAGLQARRQPHAAFDRLHVLLHEHRVRALRQRGAGEDALRGAGLQRARRRRRRRRRPDTGSTGPAARSARRTA